METLYLLKIWGILHDAIADHSGKPQAYGVDFFSFGERFELLAYAFGDSVRGHGLQCVHGLRFFGNHAERTDHFVPLHQSHRDMLHHQYTSWSAHRIPAYRRQLRVLPPKFRKRTG